MTHRLKLLVALQHEQSGFKPPGFSIRRRIQILNRMIDQHGIRVLGLETPLEKSIVEYGKKRVPRSIVESDSEFGESERKKLAAGLADWSSALGQTSAHGINDPALVDTVNSFNRFSDFVKAVRKGHFGIYEAVRHHAENRADPIRVVPLEDPELYARSIEVLVRGKRDNIKAKEKAEKVKRGEVPVLEALKDIPTDSFLNDPIFRRREKHAIGVIEREKVQCAIAGSKHAYAIGQEVPFEVGKLVAPLWGKVFNRMAYGPFPRPH